MMMATKRKPGKSQKTSLDHITLRLREILQMRGRPSQDDLAYALERLDKLRDERLKAIFIEAIGWGDEERSELETFVAIAIEVMKDTNPSKIRDAAIKVELRDLLRNAA